MIQYIIICIELWRFTIYSKIILATTFKLFFRFTKKKKKKEAKKKNLKAG